MSDLPEMSESERIGNRGASSGELLKDLFLLLTHTHKLATTQLVGISTNY